MITEEKVCKNDENDDVMDEFIKEIQIKKELKERLTKDVYGLEDLKTIAEPALAKYSKAIPEFEGRKHKVEEYSKKKTPMITSTIANKKAAVDKIISTYDDQIKSLKKEIDTINTKEKPEAENQKETARKKCEIEGKKPFDESIETLKGFQNYIDQKLEDLKKLWDGIEEVEKKDKESTLPTMYFLIGELNNIFAGTVIEKPEDLASNLYSKYKNYDILKKDAREKDEKLTVIENKLRTKQEKFDKLKETEERRKTILENITKEWEKS